MKELEQAVEALTKLRIQALKNNNDDLEKSLFDIEQMIFKAQDNLQSKGRTSPKEFVMSKGIHTKACHDTVENGMFLLVDLLEEYAQSHANKDGWVSLEEMSKLADEFMDKARGLMNDADKNGNANSIQSISFNKEAAGWKYACYSLRDALGLDRSTNKPLPPKPQI